MVRGTAREWFVAGSTCCAESKVLIQPLFDITDLPIHEQDSNFGYLRVAWRVERQFTTHVKGSASTARTASTRRLLSSSDNTRDHDEARVCRFGLGRQCFGSCQCLCSGIGHWQLGCHQGGRPAYALPLQVSIFSRILRHVDVRISNESAPNFVVDTASRSIGMLESTMKIDFPPCEPPVTPHTSDHLVELSHNLFPLQCECQAIDCVGFVRRWWCSG